ncbi:lipopolysaccharide core heptose(II)-phosphate phosphatase PmrG [Pseudomonas alabamensis]|uniref:lipopolysaccharide core heptose(II)-phosphate phosphatase PmrG n=1 Tax=Pseudomonas alabamensis TaxID=3064349 RepID=UPI0021D9AC3E|nr:histidine phosphatase family protein [Pseudomonas entomophila]
MQPAVLPSPTVSQSSPKRRAYARGWVKGMVGLALVLAAFAAWYASQTRVLEVSSAAQWRDSGIATQWAQGNVVLLIRHAERCDRSEHTCLADPEGITVPGSQRAIDVGRGLALLPQDGAERLSSPEVRTRQTAQFIFGQPLTTQDWVGDCDKDFAQAALDHKQAGHNLILVTHSGCIDQLERRLHVPGGERSSAYASALFVAVPETGRARLLGQVRSSDWRHLLARESYRAVGYVRAPMRGQDLP